MGKDVHAEAEEYNQVARELEKIHKEQMKKINNTYNSLCRLSESKGPFVMMDTSNKIQKILGMIDKKILPSIAVVFANAEKNMNKFMSDIEKIDQE